MYQTPPGSQPKPVNSDGVKRMKRRAIDMHIRAVGTYQRYARLQQIHNIDNMSEPDADDLTISKRDFEASVQVWRNRLKALVISF